MSPIRSDTIILPSPALKVSMITSLHIWRALHGESGGLRGFHERLARRGWEFIVVSSSLRVLFSFWFFLSPSLPPALSLVLGCSLSCSLFGFLLGCWVGRLSEGVRVCVCVCVCQRIFFIFMLCILMNNIQII